MLITFHMPNRIEPLWAAQAEAQGRNELQQISRFFLFGS
jgi:hypothetical protein